MSRTWLNVMIPVVALLGTGTATLAEANPMDGKQCAGKMKDMVDTDKDGKVSKDEFMKHHEEMFSKMDKNKDGVVDEAEMKEHHQEMREMHGSEHGKHKS